MTVRLAVPPRPRCWRPLRSWRKAPWRWWTRGCVPSGIRAPAACETPVWASGRERAPAVGPTGRFPGSPRPPLKLWSPAHRDSWPLRSAWARGRSSCSPSPAAWCGASVCVWRVKLKMRVARQRRTGERFRALLRGNPTPLELEILCVTLESTTNTWSEATRPSGDHLSVCWRQGRCSHHTLQRASACVFGLRGGIGWSFHWRDKNKTTSALSFSQSSEMG